MYGHYEYNSQHTVGGSSSQPNPFGSLSQPNVGGSSSPVRHFSLDDDDFTQMTTYYHGWGRRRSGRNLSTSSHGQRPSKGEGSAASSTSSFDVKALAKMMASEYVMASDSYNIQKNQEMSELLQIKKQELELKAAELKIRRMENRQRNEALYERRPMKN
nr:hypothetical protein [Tanacetum cinerariifolium]